ncbi:hypothetical protein N44_00404 [Microcystis aeruginosa NIES-44]|uniref:Uncharacterized protein n=1 Tax=Microcystis aeruginosa NIES-44 TaxID=449439 RepID=A0A0A1VS44_MICAE|nr:hypothetical protein N44_00404 [Microcystis aeruginosa NIES-44]
MMDFLLAVKPDGHDRITNIFIYPTAGTADNLSTGQKA